MSQAFRSNPITWFLLVSVLLTAGALAVGIPVHRITEVVIYTLYGVGVSILLGYTGLVPFGASVFFGCASYASALISIHIGGSELVAIFGAVIFSAILAGVLGAVIVRRRGLYFSLLTLAFSQLAFEIAFRWTPVTGGENGLQNVPRVLFTSAWEFHIFSVTTVAVILFTIWKFVHSPVGRVLQAVRDNEQRASCLGYNTYAYKLIAFVFSAAAVGCAGGLLALLLQGAYANPLSWQHAGDALLMTVFGGVHHFLGPLWGAISFILLQDKLSAITEHWWLLFAPIIILFTVFSPEGLQGIAQSVRGRQYWTLSRSLVPQRTPSSHCRAQTPPVRSGPILSLNGVTKRFGAIVTADGITIDVHSNRLHTVIGPNGAGKTTLFNLITGLMPVDGGTISLEGKDITNYPAYKRIRAGLARSFQIISLFRNANAFETVRIAVQAQHPRRFGLWCDAYALDEINARTWDILASVGLDGRAGDLCENLSHGEQRLLDIAIALASDAPLILFDEPLAGLAEADREVVSALLKRMSKTRAVLLIEHDMDRVLTLSDRITVLHHGRVIADGHPVEVANNPTVIEAYLGTSGVKAAQAIPASGAGKVPAVAKVDSGADSSSSLQTVSAFRHVRCRGKPLLRLERVSAGYEGSVVLDELSMTVHQNEVVALLGRNGVGKTTTLRAITGTAAIGSGRICLNDVEITKWAPHRINRSGIALVPEGRRLFPNLTVRENLLIAQRAGGATIDEVYELFPRLRHLHRSNAANLSGGERQMVAIGRSLMAPSHLILLDEPFEGLAPAVVDEVLQGVRNLRDRASIVIVEHKADLVLPISDRAYVLVNGRSAYDGEANELAADSDLQARLLGIVHDDTESTHPQRLLS